MKTPSDKKGLGLLDATLIVSGSMIGSGIFIVSAGMVRGVGGSGWLLLAWLLAGVITLLGALSYGELAGMMPKAGGQYVYIQKAFGKLTGFVYGWTVFTVIQTGVIAAVAVAFAKYTGQIFPFWNESHVVLQIGSFTVSWAQLLAIGLIIFLTAVNTMGIEEGKWLQRLFTLSKMLAILGLVAAAFIIGGEHNYWNENLANPFKALSFSKTTQTWGSIGSVVDQEMMQKNISVKNLKDSQKNMMLMSAVLVGVNALFLLLGAVLHVYHSKSPILLGNGLAAAGDDLFPALALSEAFSGGLGIVFVIALISALFPSVDGALTSLTSSYCIDVLNMQQSETDEKARKRKRMMVHLTFTVLFLLMVFLFRYINDKSIIQFIIKFAGITYGPLLGLFSFGLLTRRKVKNSYLWPACLMGPISVLALDLLSNPVYYEQKFLIPEQLKLGLNAMSETLFHGYKIGPELILINGLIVFAGLWIFSKKATA